MAWSKLREYLSQSGRNPEGFPNAIATMLLYVTEDRGKAERMVREVVSPAFNRPETELMPRLLIGPALECAEKLAAYQRPAPNVFSSGRWPTRSGNCPYSRIRWWTSCRGEQTPDLSESNKI